MQSGLQECCHSAKCCFDCILPFIRSEINCPVWTFLQTRSELKQQTDSEQYGVENQVTSCCESHRLSEDGEIHNVNDEQLEETSTEEDDDDNQEEYWNLLYITYQYSDQSLHETES